MEADVDVKSLKLSVAHEVQWHRSIMGQIKTDLIAFAIKSASEDY
jgi:hypothetical protein